MITVLCPICNGDGEVEKRQGSSVTTKIKCVKCDGKGYIEAKEEFVFYQPSISQLKHMFE